VTDPQNPAGDSARAYSIASRAVALSSVLALILLGLVVAWRAGLIRVELSATVRDA
jgi:hypothetical protein